MKTAKFDWNYDASAEEAPANIFVGRQTRDPKAPREARAGGARGKRTGSSSMATLLALKPTREDHHDFGADAIDGAGHIPNAPPVLIINSYAGSLVQAAKDGGYRVTGSYEDAAYGLEVQRLNFPELEGLFAGSRAMWPERSLEREVVIAHPPCAAFSAQNRGLNEKNAAAKGIASPRGVDAAKFKCTVEVADYALGRHAMALMVESVPGALDGAREIHDGLAKKHDYKLFRILQNAATFGCPQWRPRFWVVFMRPDVVGEALPLVHRPTFKSVGDLLGDGEPFRDWAEKLEKQKRMLQDAGIDLAKVFAPSSDGRLFAILEKLAGAYEFLRDEKALRALCIGANFDAQNLMVLDPRGVAPTLVHNSWFVTNDARLLARQDYCAVMGFPRDYRWPGDGMQDPINGKMSKSAGIAVRGYLSRGICPPVGTWLLDQVTGAIARRELPARGVVWCEPGDLADFRPPIKTRKGVLEAVAAQEEK
jgi:site-specific DNA-cytosine methylase